MTLYRQSARIRDDVSKPKRFMATTMKQRDKQDNSKKTSKVKAVKAVEVTEIKQVSKSFKL
jgi:hypothetical protein